MIYLVRLLLLLSAVFLLATNSYAIPSRSISPYDGASHATTNWQELATYSDANVLIDESGVFWSVDGGSSWGHEDLVVGQTVNFKFNMHKENVGTHYADFLKTWIDFGQDGTFDEEDVIIFKERALLPIEMNNLDSYNTPNKPNFSYVSGPIDILDSYVGDLWLRSRVVCSESLNSRDGGSWNDQWTEELKNKYNSIFYATGEYNQGEVEEWKINVAPVPEPATLFLLGFGMIGLAGVRRSKLKK